MSKDYSNIRPGDAIFFNNTYDELRNTITLNNKVEMHMVKKQYKEIVERNKDIIKRISDLGDLFEEMLDGYNYYHNMRFKKLEQLYYDLYEEMLDYPQEKIK